MITPDLRWSLPRGNTPVPCCWQATEGDSYCDVAGRQICAEYLAGIGLKAKADP